MAWLPSIYSLDAIQFLKVSAELSQSAEIQHFKKSVALIRTKDGKGTGFVVDSAGWVITNRHVVGDDPNPVVSVNGKRYVAQVAAISDEVDLALLSIDAQGLPELSLADHYDGEAGVPFYVIGNPLFFTGIANAGETLGLIGSSNVPMMALRAPIYRGNSGSPIITEAGEVIGVVYAMSSIQVNGSKMKIGLAVPIQWVHLLLEEAGAWSAGEETTG
jgi:serine protease Do